MWKHSVIELTILHQWKDGFGTGVVGGVADDSLFFYGL